MEVVCLHIERGGGGSNRPPGGVCFMAGATILLNYWYFFFSINMLPLVLLYVTLLCN